MISTVVKEIPISNVMEEIRSKLVDLLGHDARWKYLQIKFLAMMRVGKTQKHEQPSCLSFSTFESDSNDF